jgi:ATP-binding cassette subfamily B protein
LLTRLWRVVAPRRKVQLVGLLGFTMIASAAELFSIGAVLPLLGVLTAPQQVMRHPWAEAPLRWLGVEAAEGLLVPVTVLFCVAAVAAAVVRVAALWLRSRLSHATGADLSLAIYRHTLYQPYPVHLARHSSEVIETVSGKVNAVLVGVLHPVVVVASNGLMLLLIVGVLLLLRPGPALAVSAAFVGLHWVLFRLSRRRLSANSRTIAASAARRVKLLQEGLGGIRDVLLDRAQPAHCRAFAEEDEGLRRAQAENAVLTEAPRFVVEAMGMGGMAVLAMALARRPGGLETALPVMGTLAIAASRMLPLLRQQFSALATLRGNDQSLADILALLEQPVGTERAEPDPAPLPFDQAVALRNVGFRYQPTAPWVLKGVTLTIPRGSRVGIVGPSGSGKSTLLDLLLGLLHPEEGALLVDGHPVTVDTVRRWQRRLAHVPQDIFLADTSVARNIAFGVVPEAIDWGRVRAAAAGAQLDRTIEGWAAGYETLVGERGVRLSGGQRQRIGVARALYKGADVLVFDEATNALDAAAEAQVLDHLATLDGGLTLIMVAHRAESLRGCDLWVRVEGGRVVSGGSEQAVVGVSRTSA